MKWHVIFEPQNLELYATGILTTLGLLFSSLGIGAVLALLAGWWGLREVLRRPVVDTLRRATE